MPRIVDFEVYVKAVELSDLGIPKTNVYRDIQEGNVEIYNSEEHGKLILFSSMQWKWRKKANAFYGGDIKRYTQLLNISQAILPYCSHEDKKTLLTHVLPKGGHLSTGHRYDYENRCRVLHFLKQLHPFRDSKVEQFGMVSMKEFWEVLYEYIGREGIKLPKSIRLAALFRRYLKKGAIAVISTKFGNSNGSKLTPLQIQTIIELYADRDGRKFTKKQVHEQFLFIAEEQGWKSFENMTYANVSRILKETRGQWHLARHGEKDFKLHQTLIINRRKVSGRNVVWQLDGTPECLWYYDANRKTIDKLYVMKVMDSRTWKIVGYSIGYTETSNLVFEGMKMACTLLGTKPREVRSDKGSAMQAGETKELMENLGATFYPTATGNARAKSIESWQAHFNQQVLVYFRNKSGANITAKSLDSRQNPDKLKEFAKEYPTKSELVMQIRLAMELWNRTPNSKGITPDQSYEQSEEGGKEMNIIEQFDLFYIWRKKGKKLQKYRFGAQGLTMEVSGNRSRYIPELEPSALANFMNAHTDVTDFYVKYDPSDLSQVGFYTLPLGKEETAKNMQLVCEGKMKGLTAETYKDASEEEKARLVALRAAQKQQVRQAKEITEKRRSVLEHQNVMNGAIELERVHKDKYNDAKIALERLEVLGYDDKISSDVNKELSAASMIEDDALEEADFIFEDNNEEGEDDDLNVYGLPKI